MDENHDEASAAKPDCITQLRQTVSALTSVVVFLLLAGINAMDKLTRCPEDTTGGRDTGQSDRPPRSREEMRELVNTPLPSTWRRSSLPSEETSLVEELRLQAAGDTPTNRVVQPALGSWGGPTALPVVKSRRESRRSSLNVGPLVSNNAFIDVRKNPV